MYEYRCEVERVIDGDTVEVHIDLGFDVWLRRQKIRLAGVNAPEVRSRNAAERGAAAAARDRLASLLPVAAGTVLVVTRYNATEKYGRILGTLFANGRDVREVLLHEGLVQPLVA